MVKPIGLPRDNRTLRSKAYITILLRSNSPFSLTGLSLRGRGIRFYSSHNTPNWQRMIDQSRQLKISGAEKITDKVIEEKDSKNNNTKDNK